MTVEDAAVSEKKSPGRVTVWVKRLGLLLVLLTTVGSASGAWWFFARYEHSKRMNVPLREFTKFEYPENPGSQSVHCGQYDGRRLELVQRDETHFDFVLVPLEDHVATVVVENVDVSLMTPGVPEWTKSDPGLVRIALTDREWNRQQVQFDVHSENVTVTGGDGYEEENLAVVSLAKNCLNAGLWEVILSEKDETGKKGYYQGWFTFPMGHYKRLVEHNTGFDYWDHWYKLEHWSDPAGTVVNLDGLRTVLDEETIEAHFDRSEAIVVGGEQVRKKRTQNGVNLVSWGDVLDRADITYATFRPPGVYDVEVPWGNEYWRLAEFREARLRDVTTPAGPEVLKELEVVFEGRDGSTNRFLVGGINLHALPQLPLTSYPKGLYMPMGIGVPPFYQSYADLLENDPMKSSYYSVLLDENDRWIDHHVSAIDGPVLIRDEKDPALVHLFLLSYERHSLVAHFEIPIGSPYELPNGSERSLGRDRRRVVDFDPPCARVEGTPLPSHRTDDHMGFDVAGCTALVTGANRGIGRSIVESLVGHGASKVYAAVRKLDSAGPLVDEYGDKVVPVEIDLEKPETIEAAGATATDVSLVVSNAGVLRTSNAVADDAIENLQYEIDVNVFGLIRMARAFAPALAANGGGAFVQLNSVASLKCFPPFATYSASKAAAYSITQGLKETLGEQNTHVLSVHPGPIETNMASDAGLEDTDPPSVVAEGIVAALAAGDYHLFPDRMAKDFWAAYEGFAKGVVEPSMSEG